MWWRADEVESFVGTGTPQAFYDALVKRFLGLLAKHGGSLDRRGLIKNLHIDHLTFRRIVMTLHMCDAIIEESEYGKNTVYTLKDAA